jgi:hypothetical protein
MPPDVVFMKIIIKNQKVSWAIRIVIVSLALCLTHGLCYFQGKVTANREATILMANEDCFVTLLALQGADNPELATKFRPLLERTMDHSSVRLADMCLEYPKYAKRTHYNLLVRIKNFRGKVDPKVEKAISCLESIHDMKTWGLVFFDTNGTMKTDNN